MRVALIGGSFNPPHVGHLLAATYVRATQRMDEVWLVPSFQHPFGKELVAFDHRLAMCERLCEDGKGWLRVSAVERELAGPGYTVAVLSHLRVAHPEHQFSLVVGSDLLPELSKWKDSSRIEQLARLLILYRAGHPDARALGPPLAEVSSSEVRRRIARGGNAEELVPSAVLDYLRRQGLYQS